MGKQGVKFRSVVGIALALCVISIAGCAGAGTAGPSGSVAVSSRSNSAGITLIEALALAEPIEHEVLFVDYTAAEQRAGVTDVTGPDLTARRDRSSAWRQAMLDAGVSPMTSVEVQEAPWGAPDVDWSMQVNGGIGPSYFKLRDDLDMQLVIGSFVDHGYLRTDAGDAVRLEPDPTSKDGFGDFLFGLTIIPDRHLIVSNILTAYVVPAAGQSAAQQQDLLPLTTGLPAADLVSLAIGSGTCRDPQQAAFVQRDPAKRAEMVRRIAQRFSRGLGLVTGSVLAQTSTGTQVVTRYASADAAAADLTIRRELISDGDLAGAPWPFSADVQQDDASLRYQVTPAAGKKVSVIGASTYAGAPWNFCR